MYKSILFLALFLAHPAFAEKYDIVIENGRVMDPETGLDAMQNVGVANGKIARISAEPLSGTRLLNAKGVGGGPGFIGLHQHGQDADSGRVKAFDGVTTALEMEIGVPDAKSFLAEKSGRSLINYGTSASHVAARSS